MDEEVLQARRPQGKRISAANTAEKAAEISKRAVTEAACQTQWTVFPGCDEVPLLAELEVCLRTFGSDHRRATSI
jgi:hypothetical protein